MDFRWLKSLSEEFTGLGIAPTPREILAMQASVPILAQKHEHDITHFWGKITGTQRAYLIISCYKDGLLGEKTYYASLDGVSWFGLPLVTETLIFHANHIRSRITGNPLTITRVNHPRKPIPFKEYAPLIPPKPRNEEEEEEEDQQEPEKEKEEEEEEEEEEKPEYETVSITEDQRIACIVHIIDKNGLIFPQDALLWADVNHTKVNPLFKTVSDDITLDDFCRLDKSVRGESARENGIIDTMPLLSEDLPTRGWVISRESFSGVTKIMSRLWPGLCFITKGPQWGTVYLGSGTRNTDFLFATE
ncbi:Radial spoke head protein 9 [Tritrichomonas musculus]|uniref:Radial spoke head protein 9 homolog n=1 Tax=Tritrichomonas musculus TaxID=1915356 RepID=A0ABR2KU39_9EUKA